MLRYFIAVICFGAIFGNGMWVVKPGPKYPPTKGEVWPKPQYETKRNTYHIFNPSNFKVKVINQTCDILTNAVERYSYVMRYKNGLRFHERKIHKRRRRIANDALYRGTLNEFEIDLTAPCEDYPSLDMNEQYHLTIAATSTLTSSSIWGILRGLETLAQLFYLSNDRNEIRINETDITDFPRYKHRGLLLDTARHYISVSNILKTLDAMEMNKMNVFHWHIVDDQSFPYQSEKFPELSELGAYDSSMVYTREDIERVVRYARDRGIRVVPEFDAPGHTTSWGVAYPAIMTECYSGDRVIGAGPMDPTNNMTYKLLKDLFQEVQTWFPDKYFHIGGDEVQLDCWSTNPTIQKYMKDYNLTASMLHAMFMRKVIPLLAPNSKPIVWQEVFDEGVDLSRDTLIQVWKYNWISEMIRILRAGHKLLFSSTWYLDALSSEWPAFYTADPRLMLAPFLNNDTLLANVVGGEACMWGEMVDDRNVINRVWPRASAVAEKLWSAAGVGGPGSPGGAEGPAGAGGPAPHTYARLEEHACRMLRRGVDAQPPSGPGFCLL
ncbi:unnamed protein product, partial [Brenthis ino]